MNQSSLPIEQFVTFKPLNEDSIRHYLSDLSFIAPIGFHIVNSIDSTNTYLKNTPSNATEISVCIAETQTNGRGRLGRHWVSPFGENIYLSSRWTLHDCVSKLAGLSLVVSLAIQASLEQQGINDTIQVKWPNDLLWQHKKLCGVLIEVIPDIKGNIQVIIGIGLNVNTVIKDDTLIDKPWCSLHEITHQYFDRNKLIAHLLWVLNGHLKQFRAGGFNAFLTQWNKVDYLKGHNITLMHPNGLMQGIANGVSEKGNLYLIDNQGKQHELSSGEANLIKVTN